MLRTRTRNGIAAAINPKRPYHVRCIGKIIQAHREDTETPPVYTRHLIEVSWLNPVKAGRRYKVISTEWNLNVFNRVQVMIPKAQFNRIIGVPEPTIKESDYWLTGGWLVT